MGDAGRLDGTDLFEAHIRVAAAVEETGAATEQHRNDAQFELVQQSRGQVLPSAAFFACSSADSIPSVTKWNVVPPSISTALRG
ncbi:hypothetical protein AB0H18_01015 [Streptomyces sp. NPDC020766]|uniref:hypothetical protein n=1 Tax=Streptomyces sp. NPDC020766 TaxID=3155011 RepID=UPI0033CB90EE